MTPQTFTVPEVAAMLGVDPSTVYAAVRGNDPNFPIPWLRVGRRVLFARHAAEGVLGPLPDAEAAQ